jgi:hypothetical protein
MTDERGRLSFHEAAHAVAAIAEGIPVQAASLRPGLRFNAAVLLGPPSGELGRADAESRIVVTLSGRVGETLAEPLTGQPRPHDEKRAAREAMRALAAHSPTTADLVLAAEAADDCESDEISAYRRSLVLSDFDQNVAAAHLNYLRTRALRVVERHRPALRAVAGELYRRTVLDGVEIEALVRGFRCSCHLEWGPPSASALGTPN